MGYKVGSPRGDLSYDTRDSAFAVPKAMVCDPSFGWGNDAPPRIPRADTVICEAHVRGLTMRHPGVERALRGSYLGLACDAVLEHLVKLGITTVELLPIQAFVDDALSPPAACATTGATTRWPFCAGTALHGPRRLVGSADHGPPPAFGGIEVILDVVYNHTAEGDEWGRRCRSGASTMPAITGWPRAAALCQRHRHRQHAEPDASDGAADGDGQLALLGRTGACRRLPL
jgi:isoamylase